MKKTLKAQLALGITWYAAMANSSMTVDAKGSHGEDEAIIAGALAHTGGIEQTIHSV